MEEKKGMENLEFRDMRHARSVSPVTLANQYRLSQQPKRPEKKKITRKKKLLNAGDIYDDSVPTSASGRHLSDASNHSWLLNMDEEEFDFDADEDSFFDAIPDAGSQPHQIYNQACIGLDVRPVRCLYEALKKSEESLVCKGLVLKHKDVQAITIALVSATCVESLDFEGNLMGKEGAEYFGDVLQKNVYLTDIRIAYNALGSLEAEAICFALLKNMTVRKLNLTGNQFNENDAKYFKELLTENSAIKELYLGHNYFRETGGEQIAEGLANNDFLEILDLSWNHLRLRGAAAIGEALTKNRGLLVLNISWNGFHCNGTMSLAKALEVNRYLVDLDLSCNRLSESCIAQILKGLQKNTTLTTLKIGKNCLTPKGATSMVQFLKDNITMGLTYIDLADQCVEEDFQTIFNEINEIRPLTIKHGGVWSNDREPIGSQDPSEDELALLNENPLFVLMEMMKVLGFRLVDLFHVLDKDHSKSISIDEFKEGLETVQIPLKRKSLETFVKGVDADKSGEIEYLELANANRQYKDKLKQYVRDGIPIENTDIGRIAKLVRKIIKEDEMMRATKYNKK